MVLCGFLYVDCYRLLRLLNELKIAVDLILLYMKVYVAFFMQCLIFLDFVFIVNFKLNLNNQYMGYVIVILVYVFVCKRVLVIYEKLYENFKRGFYLNIKI